MTQSRPLLPILQRATSYVTDGRGGGLSFRSQVLVTALVLALLYAINLFFDLVLDKGGLDVVLPLSIGTLTANDWYAFLATSSSAIVSYTIVVFIAYWLGVIASVFARSTAWQVKLFGASLAHLYNFFFVVPVVLTATMVMTVLLKKSSEGVIPGPLVVSGSMVFAALCIAGYPIFWSLFKGSVHPDNRHGLLVQALYDPTETSRLAVVRTRVALVRRLNDGQIRNFADSIERAWPLTIVSVVIIESIHPGIYGFLHISFPGLAEYVSGGVGREVIQAQHSLDVAKVWGFMWVLFLLDLVGMLIIDLALERRYLRHYRGTR